MSAAPPSRGNPISVTDDVGRLFALALTSGRVAAIGAHLRAGKSVNSRDWFGRTPLMLTAARGHIEACEFLIKAGCDPALIDGSGMDAANWARHSGHTKVVEYLDSIGRGSQPRIAEPVTEVRASAVQTAPHTCEWEVYDEPTTPHHDAMAVAEVGTMQRTLSSHTSEFDDEEWRDVPISLPSIIFDRIASSNFPDDVRDYLVKGLVEGTRAGLIDLTEIDRFMPPFEEAGGGELLARFAQIASDVGIQIVGLGSPYRNELGDTNEAEASPEERGNSAELVLEIDHLLDSRHDPLFIAESEVSRVRRLARFEEIALFRLIRNADEEVALAIVQSSPALALLKSYCRQILAGKLPFTVISNLDPDEHSDLAEGDVDDQSEHISDAHESGADEVDKSGQPDAALQAESPKIPTTLLATMEKVLSAADRRDQSPSAVARNLARDIKELALSDGFLERLLSDLKKEGDGAGVKVISSFRSAAKDARDKIIVAHLPHILRLARRLEGKGLPVSDLFQEGCIGLFRAIDLFDPDRGFRFQTYAMHWVRQAVSRALADKARLIRVPVHVLEKLTKLDHFRREFSQIANYQPTPELISQKLEIPVEITRKLLRIPDEPIDLDEFVDDDDRVGDRLSPFGLSSERIDGEQVDLRRAISGALLKISPRAERVIRMRFGIGMKTDHTLEEVGQQFGVTRERIRQIEAKALRMLRHPSRGTALRGLLDQ